MTAPRHPGPTEAQVAAADPRRSNWVSANAGSGKTRVLTERIARLLLAGTPPERILCLTYTKAAASVMQNRLVDMLGRWTMADAAGLSHDLARLTGVDVAGDTARIAEARRLFARALETPGGLKIQTIHAFCDALLRRFPLEAAVSPRFEVMDERTAEKMHAHVLAQMAEDAEQGRDDAFDRAARRLNEGGIDQLIAGILARRDMFGTGSSARLEAHFGALPASPQALAAEALSALDWDRLRLLSTALSLHGSAKDSALADAISQAGLLHPKDPSAAAAALIGAALTQKGTPRKGLPTKAVCGSMPDAAETFNALADWAHALRDAGLRAEIGRRTDDLHRFASGFLKRYASAKEARGLLDFDDLVGKARDLLVHADTRAWVLYKLDQGIDHILVDEAQDTAPQQWEVIDAIVQEFQAGEGAASAGRSLFVVGDEKQSIYSFQGAEPKAFGEMRTRNLDRLSALGTPLGQPALITSFRSVPTILEFVDQVFDGDAASGLTVDDTAIRHAASRQADRGRVDLWPLVQPDPAAPAPDWWEPLDAPARSDAKERLARIIAAEIARMCAEELRPARNGTPGEPVRPGDILVLVGRRDRLARGIIRELKARDVPVAGADRLSLAQELAVMDLLALAKVATCPGDDLSLAAVLRSPLCGMSEEELCGVAHGRDGTLWQALRKSGRHGETVAFLDDMAAAADFLRPYEFLERALGRHRGRQRLLARLGVEAEDPIDELLAEALTYEAQSTPALADFIVWIERADIDVKREMEQGKGEVRVMTVHGAKGLEAPIVILPDTMAQRSGGQGRPLLLPAGDPEICLWAGASANDDVATADARAERTRLEAEERRRLLYVALTRAEDWLILCGAGTPGRSEGTWYGLLDGAMDRCAEALEVPGPEGVPMRRLETGPSAAATATEPMSTAAPTPEPRPDWLTAAPHEKRPRRLSPSALVEEPTAVGGRGLGRELALLRGSAVHRLLECLPDITPAARTAAGQRLMASEFSDLDGAIRADALAEALRALALPEAAALFGPDALAEAGIALPVAGHELPMLGRIDRLLVSDEHVMLCDIKTDSQVPDTSAQVPRAYLAQLGAYRRALSQIYPERKVDGHILWTASPELMLVEPNLLDHAFDHALAQPA